MNEWIGIIGIIVAILVPAVSGIILIVIKLSSRVSKNETNIENIQRILDKQATQEGLNALSNKIDLFYKLVRDTADTLINKHVEGEHEYRKSVIAANANVDKLERQLRELEKENVELEKENDKLRKKDA